MNCFTRESNQVVVCRQTSRVRSRVAAATGEQAAAKRVFTLEVSGDSVRSWPLHHGEIVRTRLQKTTPPETHKVRPGRNAAYVATIQH